MDAVTAVAAVAVVAAGVELLLLFCRAIHWYKYTWC
jgi:hypothetical protein